MYRARSDEGQRDAVALLGGEDEEIASGCAAKLLITAATQREVEALALRIHGAGLRAALPFVHLWACELPTSAEPLRKYCARLLDAAAGGSILINDVEDMPQVAQEFLLDLLTELQVARPASTRMRLISGTTVSLLDRVTAGTFSNRLFYRLNSIHLVQRDVQNII